MYYIDVNISPFAIVLNVAALVDSADLVVVPVEVVFVGDLVCITLITLIYLSAIILINNNSYSCQRTGAWA